jgi:hypothetical protein
MKLYDWQITDFLRDGNWLGAVDAACDFFQIEKFEPCAAVRAMSIYPSSEDFHEIRIVVNGNVHVWSVDNKHIIPTFLDVNRIIIWAARAP